MMTKAAPVPFILETGTSSRGWFVIAGEGGQVLALNQTIRTEEALWMSGKHL